MKTKNDAVKGWLRKAESDLTALRFCIAGRAALDVACFHAQQAAEKFLKAYLTYCDIRFPFVHNLEQLADICEARDPSFHKIKKVAQTLTPYAVELRYDDEFWPTIATAQSAAKAVHRIKRFVMARLPRECA